MRFPFVFFSRMRSEGFSFYFVGLGVETLFARRCFCVRNLRQPFATIHEWPRWGQYGRAYGEFCKRGHFWRFQTSRSIVSWAGHFVTFQHVSERVQNRFVTGHHAFASFSEDDFHVSQQAQYFECVHLAFAWQRSTSDVCSCVFFCESHCEGCVKWWQRANRVASVGHRENVIFRGSDNIWCKSVARGMSNCVAGAVFSTLYTPHCTLTL